MNELKIMPLPAIEFSQLCKTFKGKKKTLVHALQDLNLTIPAGEVFGFIGPNGAGKSTSIKILTGQIKASSGTAQISDIPATSPQARKNIGYLPENPSFYPFMTAREYLHFVGQIFKMAPEKITRETNRVLELLDLSQAANRSVKGFSKGMTQRLGLAQALLHDPAVYILDEPMSGLDPVGRALVKDIILSLKQQGKTIFFSTHIIADVEAVCDRAGIIVNGRLTALEDIKGGIMPENESYILHIKTSNGDLENHVVGKKQLNETILQAVAQGATIERIEPQVKNLEKIFLSTITSGNTL